MDDLVIRPNALRAIRHHRDAGGQRWLAELFGVAQPQISRWEQGRGSVPAERWIAAEPELALGGRSHGERAPKYMVALVAHDRKPLPLFRFILDERDQLGVFSTRERAVSITAALLASGFEDACWLPLWDEVVRDAAASGTQGRGYYLVDEPGGGDPIQELFAVPARCFEFLASALRGFARVRADQVSVRV